MQNLQRRELSKNAGDVNHEKVDRNRTRKFITGLIQIIAMIILISPVIFFSSSKVLNDIRQAFVSLPNRLYVKNA